MVVCPANGALPWRKWRLRPSRRPWFVSPIALIRLSPPLTTRCFRRPTCPTHSNLPAPGKPSVPPSHEHSDWLFLCLFRFLPTGNRSGAVFPRRERSSVCEVYRTCSYICRRLALKKHPVWSGMFTHPTSPYAHTPPQSWFLRSHRSSA